MRTEIFNFNETNIDGNGTNAQVLVRVTGSDFDYASVSDHIKKLKQKTDYPDTDYLVDETCKWLESKGNKCTYISFSEIEF